jgi:DNA primase
MAADILAAIKLLTGETLEPKGRKNWKRVNCPFHHDRQASATVNLELGVFVCHGCEVRGDAVALIRKVKKCSFQEALKISGSISGLSMTGASEPKERTRLTSKPDKQRARRIRERFGDNRL